MADCNRSCGRVTTRNGGCLFFLKFFVLDVKTVKKKGKNKINMNSDGSDIR